MVGEEDAKGEAGLARVGAGDADDVGVVSGGVAV